MTTAKPQIERRAHAIPAVIGAGVIALIVALGIAYDHGRAMHRHAVGAEYAANERDDDAFCADLGLVRATMAFARCRRGLAEVRRIAEERINAR